MSEKDEGRYYNALRWIRAIADVRFVGGDFDIDHMRELARLADIVLNGHELPDFDKSMEGTRQRAREIATQMIGHLDSVMAETIRTSQEEASRILRENVSKAMEKARDEAGQTIEDAFLPEPAE